MPRDRGLGAGRRGHTHGHADPQAVTERPRVFLPAQASPPLVVVTAVLVTATINGSLPNGRRHGGEWPGSRRRVLSSPAPTSEGRSMSHESQQDQRATRRGVLLGVGIAGIGGVLAGCSTAAVPYGADEAGMAPGQQAPAASSTPAMAGQPAAQGSGAAMG